MKEPPVVEESPDPLEEGSPAKVPELEVIEETQVQEMTLDEWKTPQEQTRPKPEFNIQGPFQSSGDTQVPIER